MNEHDNNDDSNVNFHEDITNKVRFLTGLVVWIVGCMLVVPVSVPGIIISVQYSTDKCVKGTTQINIALDAWLCIACIGMIISTLFTLVGLCVNIRRRVLKGFGIFIAIVYGLWAIIGWYLFANSTLGCDHDSLWVMSLIYLCLLSTTELCTLVWTIATSNFIKRCCGCCCGRGGRCSGCCGKCRAKCLDLNDIENRIYRTSTNKMFR